MNRNLWIQNRQRAVPVHTPRFRELARMILNEGFRAAEYELGVVFLGKDAMASLNEEHLRHAGATDILTFDYSAAGASMRFHGELLLCPAVARKQAVEFHTTWPEELTRYFIHGLLHLDGGDDREPIARRRMKQRENRWMRWVTQRFPIAELARS